jgi:hypothetical protein
MNLKSGLAKVVSRLRPPKSNAEQAALRYVNYSKAARRVGLREPLLFLSFDCDTDLDAEVVVDLYRFLQKLGIQSSYAVPGIQLQRHPKPYRELAAMGAEFMNHGARAHAEWDTDRWVGITFYSDMERDAVARDIVEGDRIVRETLGVEPLGFRAPHFGSFQKPEDLDLIYSTVQRLGYTYSTTTTPALGLAEGPILFRENLVEIPCFGSIRNPETILDSWTYLVNKVDYSLKEEYSELLDETLRICRKQEIPAILNWYADPCHVVGQTAFMSAMERIKEEKIKSVTGRQIAERFRR